MARLYSIIIAIGLLPSAMHAASPHSVVNSVFGGSENLKAFLAADHIGIARLHHKSQAELRETFKKFTGKLPDENDPTFALHGHTMMFYTADASIALSKDDTQMLKKLLSEPHCDQVGVLVGTGDDPPRVNLEEDFDLIRPQLLALVKGLLPSDAELQGLSSERTP